MTGASPMGKRWVVMVEWTAENGLQQQSTTAGSFGSEDGLVNQPANEGGAVGHVDKGGTGSGLTSDGARKCKQQ